MTCLYPFTDYTQNWSGFTLYTQSWSGFSYWLHTNLIWIHFIHTKLIRILFPISTQIWFLVFWSVYVYSNVNVLLCCRKTLTHTFTLVSQGLNVKDLLLLERLWTGQFGIFEMASRVLEHMLWEEEYRCSGKINNRTQSCAGSSRLLSPDYLRISSQLWGPSDWGTQPLISLEKEQLRSSVLLSTS